MLNKAEILTEELLLTRIQDLIPQTVLKSVVNPDKLEIISLYDSSQVLNFVIVEHDCDGLTDEENWQNWIKTNEKKASLEREKRSRWGVNASGKINRLHEKFKKNIEEGELSLNDRILITCQLMIVGGEEAVLYVANYDGEKNKGFATDFYTNSLPKLARKLGIKIIAGMNGSENIDFFIKKLGRYTHSQLKPKKQQELFPETDKNSAKHLTIQLVDPNDVEKYILAAEIKPKSNNA